MSRFFQWLTKKIFRERQDFNYDKSTVKKISKEFGHKRTHQRPNDSDTNEANSSDSDNSSREDKNHYTHALNMFILRDAGIELHFLDTSLFMDKKIFLMFNAACR